MNDDALLRKFMMPSEYEGKRVWQAKEWDGDFEQQFKIGDLFTVDFARFFRDVVPPASETSTYVQYGEPYSHPFGRPTYTTFEAVKGTIAEFDSVWRYCGHCFKGERSEQTVE